MDKRLSLLRQKAQKVLYRMRKARKKAEFKTIIVTDLERLKMTKKTRDSARDEDCSLRLGQCSSNETVVLCHIGRNRGIAIKCGDHFAVYACSNCHDIIDGRVKSEFSKVELQAEKLRALEETQGKLIDKGLLCLK